MKGKGVHQKPSFPFSPPHVCTFLSSITEADFSSVPCVSPWCHLSYVKSLIFRLVTQLVTTFDILQEKHFLWCSSGILRHLSKVLFAYMCGGMSVRYQIIWSLSPLCQITRQVHRATAVSSIEWCWSSVPHIVLDKYSIKREDSSLQSHCKQASTEKTGSAPHLTAFRLFLML